MRLLNAQLWYSKQKYQVYSTNTKFQKYRGCADSRLNSDVQEFKGHARSANVMQTSFKNTNPSFQSAKANTMCIKTINVAYYAIANILYHTFHVVPILPLNDFHLYCLCSIYILRLIL